MKQKIAIYGATGTIGDNALALIDAHPERFEITLLTAHTNIKKLAALTQKYMPPYIVVGQGHKQDFHNTLPDYKGEVLEGEAGLLEAAQHETDMALMAIVGFAALPPTLALQKQGTTIALANKECLVVAGELIMAGVNDKALLLPVDSEHNAIFQLLQNKNQAEVEKIVITASGGPFRTYSRQQMESVTPAQAIAHPNWRMGEKISVDSATLMNKGLELIEAHHLFAIAPDKLDVLVHQESVVHGLVYFNDGAVLAQKSLPDMRIPLASVLAYPDRIASTVPPLDLAAIGTLHFEEVDRGQFPCLALAEQALESGGFAPTILNAANEVAVAAFLATQIGFLDIERVVAESLSSAPVSTATPPAHHSLEAIITCDTETRKFCTNLIQNRL
ncbi:MAG: 1-deoxy-D-xylulose-5-phosphate reductoisomerase [Alphaproteobacteria bacterium]|nr:1-deoxy-D-xylulose-5-phosphate reductoisomerase [Alphaproteobacteria bacterium]